MIYDIPSIKKIRHGLYKLTGINMREYYDEMTGTFEHPTIEWDNAEMLHIEEDGFYLELQEGGVLIVEGKEYR